MRRRIHGKKVVLVCKIGLLQLINKSASRDCARHRSTYLPLRVLSSRSRNILLFLPPFEILGCLLKKPRRKINCRFKFGKEGEKLGNASFLGPWTRGNLYGCRWINRETAFFLSTLSFFSPPWVWRGRKWGMKLIEVDRIRVCAGSNLCVYTWGFVFVGAHVRVRLSGCVREGICGSVLAGA